MANTMLMSNEGGYTFYLYQNGKIEARFQQKIDSGEHEIVLIKGQAMLLHGVMGALSESVETSDFSITNIDGNWRVGNARLMPGGSAFTDDETFITILVK